MKAELGPLKNERQLYPAMFIAEFDVGSSKIVLFQIPDNGDDDGPWNCILQYRTNGQTWWTPVQLDTELEDQAFKTKDECAEMRQVLDRAWEVFNRWEHDAPELEFIGVKPTPITGPAEFYAIENVQEPYHRLRLLEFTVINSNFSSDTKAKFVCLRIPDGDGDFSADVVVCYGSDEQWVVNHWRLAEHITYHFGDTDEVKTLIARCSEAFKLFDKAEAQSADTQAD